MASIEVLFAAFYESHDRMHGRLVECLALLTKMEDDSTVTTTEEILDDVRDVQLHLDVVPDAQLHPVAVPCAQIDHDVKPLHRDTTITTGCSFGNPAPSYTAAAPPRIHPNATRRRSRCRRLSPQPHPPRCRLHHPQRHGRQRRSAECAYRRPRATVSSDVRTLMDGLRPRSHPPQPPPGSLHLLWPPGPGPGVVRLNAPENECCERLVYYGLSTNLVNYMKTRLGLENAVAANTITNWLGIFYIKPCVHVSLVLEYEQTHGGWRCCFGILVVGMTIAVVSFFGTLLCRHQKPGGSLITSVAQALVASACKWNMTVPAATGSALHETLVARETSIEGSRKLEHTNQFRFLDKAAVVAWRGAFILQRGLPEADKYVDGGDGCGVSVSREMPGNELKRVSIAVDIVLRKVICLYNLINSCGVLGSLYHHQRAGLHAAGRRGFQEIPETDSLTYKAMMMQSSWDGLHSEALELFVALHHILEVMLHSAITYLVECSIIKVLDQYDERAGYGNKFGFPSVSLAFSMIANGMAKCMDNCVLEQFWPSNLNVLAVIERVEELLCTTAMYAGLKKYIQWLLLWPPTLSLGTLPFSQWVVVHDICVAKTNPQTPLEKVWLLVGGVSTSRELMSYNYGALKSYMPELVEVLIDCVRNPASLDWEVTEEILKLQEELEKASTETLLLDALHSTGYSRTLAKPLIASGSSVGRSNTNVLEYFLAEKYPAPRIVLAVSSVDHDELVSIAEPLLQDIPNAAELRRTLKKAYIFSDNGWFMDVFIVRDRSGKKIMEESVLGEITNYIHKSLGGDSCIHHSRKKSVVVELSSYCTLIELTGTDRPGLLSVSLKISSVLNFLLGCKEEGTHLYASLLMAMVNLQVMSSSVISSKLHKILVILSCSSKDSYHRLGGKPNLKRWGMSWTGPLTGPGWTQTSKRNRAVQKAKCKGHVGNGIEQNKSSSTSAPPSSIPNSVLPLSDSPSLVPNPLL